MVNAVGGDRENRGDDREKNVHVRCGVVGIFVFWGIFGEVGLGFFPMFHQVALLGESGEMEEGMHCGNL